MSEGFLEFTELFDRVGNKLITYGICVCVLITDRQEKRKRLAGKEKKSMVGRKEEIGRKEAQSMAGRNEEYGKKKVEYDRKKGKSMREERKSMARGK